MSSAVIQLTPTVSVGTGCVPFFIAEGGNNHQGEIRLAKRLIDMSVLAGADCIKFQKRNTPLMMTKAMRDAPYTGRNSFGPTYGEHRANLELSAEEWEELSAYAKERDILFTASAWDEDSVDLLDRLNVPFYKMASADLTNIPLLEYVVSKGRPMFLSTGMDDLETVQKVVGHLEGLANCPPLVIMHCVSTYPASTESLCLSHIKLMTETFPKHVIGYSGHENGIAQTLVAVAVGAHVVERHITLNHNWPGSDHAASLEFDGLRRVVRDVHSVPLMLGVAPKVLDAGIEPMKKKLAKSVTIVVPLKKGTVLRREHLTTKSPGNGVSPHHLNDMVGRTLVKDVDGDTTLFVADVGLSE